MRWPVFIPGRKLNAMAIIIVLSVMGGLIVSVFWHGSTAVISGLNGNHVIVIDPGHGGYDPGAITKQGIYEKNINLQMAKKISDLLKPTGIKVELTRDEDEDYVPDGVSGKTTKKQIDLNHRINMAAQAKADLYISIHLNATKSGRNSGAETFYHYNSPNGKKLAEEIQEELIKIPGMNRRVAKPGDFYIIKNTSMPAVIVELGYISNEKEQKKLLEPWYQDLLAKAVAKGIAKYLGLP